MATKIDVISGFLGAGKTTFIKKLLGGVLKNEKVILIENEFGEIAIDSGFLKDTGIEIKEMSQGCICCSLVGDFEKALKEVIDKFKPDRVIIEPSGVGKLSDIMKAITDAAANLDVVLNSSVTVVDAKKCKMYMKNFGEFFNNQIQYAGTIVLSRTDLADRATIEDDIDFIRVFNKNAEIITTPVTELESERLLEIIEKRDDMLSDLRKEALSEPDGESKEEHEHHHHHGDHEHCMEHEDHEHCEHHTMHHEGDKEDHEHCEHHMEHHGPDGHCAHHHEHHHDHDADEVFMSVGISNVPAMSRDMLEHILEGISDDESMGILRAKGMIKGTDIDRWYHFDLVPGEVDIREGSADYTGKVCIIGSNLDEDRLKAMFNVK